MSNYMLICSVLTVLCCTVLWQQKPRWLTEPLLGMEDLRMLNLVKNLNIVSSFRHNSLQRENDLKVLSSQVLGRHGPQRRGLVYPEWQFKTKGKTKDNCLNLWDSTIGQYIWKKSWDPSRSVPNPIAKRWWGISSPSSVLEFLTM